MCACEREREREKREREILILNFLNYTVPEVKTQIIYMLYELGYAYRKDTAIQNRDRPQDIVDVLENTNMKIKGKFVHVNIPRAQPCSKV